MLKSLPSLGFAHQILRRPALALCKLLPTGSHGHVGQALAPFQLKEALVATGLVSPPDCVLRPPWEETMIEISFMVMVLMMAMIVKVIERTISFLKDVLNYLVMFCLFVGLLLFIFFAQLYYQFENEFT